MNYSNVGGGASHNVSHVPSTSKSQNHQKQFKSLQELTDVVNLLLKESAGASMKETISKVLDCLATFKKEAKALADTNDCNYEEAFVHYKLASICLSSVIPNSPDFATSRKELRDLVRELTTQTLKFSKQFDAIKQTIVSSNRQNLSMAVTNATSPATPASPTGSRPDDLVSRFNRLKGADYTPSSMTSFSSPLVPIKRAKNDSYTHLALVTPNNGVVHTPVRTIPSGSIPRSRSQSPSIQTLASKDPQSEAFFAKLYVNLQSINGGRNPREFPLIEAEQLSSCISAHPESVLLIDVRNRYQYDSHHILFHNTVNIEPLSIKMSHNDAQLDQSLLVSPEYERSLFDRRFDFELIVLLDNEAAGKLSQMNPDLVKLFNILTSVPLNPHSPNSSLKRHPVVLNGGISRWTKLYPSTVHVASVQNTPSIHFSAAIDDEDEPMTDVTPLHSIPDASPTLQKVSLARKQVASGSFSSVDSYHRDLNQYLTDSPHEPLALTPPANFKKLYPSSPTYAGKGREIPSSPKAPPPVPARASKGPGKQTTPIDISKLLEEFTCGLKNLGNSCYMNCIVQCLSGTPNLISFFLNGSFKNHINKNNRLGSGGVLSTNFKDLERLMLSNDKSYVIPSEFKKVLGTLNSQFRHFDQQDCIELLDYLLDGLHEDLNTANRDKAKAFLELTEQEELQRELLPVRLASTIEWERYLKSNFSIVVDFFQGQYYSQLRCLTCNTTSTTYNAFSILSLPIPNETSSRAISLEQCLDEFCATEILDGDDKWNCVRCKSPQRSSKRLQITRLPNVIIIHFKRFKMNHQMTKLNTMITYPVDEVLDLTNYWPTPVDANEQAKLAHLPTRNQHTPFRYKLYGVANHFGNLQNGHYTAFVHKGEANGWCQFDDTTVTKNVKSSKVMNENAYCLFYKRV